MRILAIETSCDETSAAVVEGKPNDKQVSILSNVISTSLSLHAKTGGIIPETAAREQIKYIIPVIQQALINANLKLYPKPYTLNPDSIDALAVTIGPGLIGSLLVGVETAKTLAMCWNKPIIPVNHLYGHIYANFLTTNDQGPTTIQFPALALIASGGHTDLVLIKDHKKIKWIAGTRDDAAGEAFDKIGRLLNLSYPGGPEIEKRAKAGNPKVLHLPRPLLYEDTFDFSFSGLKTAVLREVQKHKELSNQQINDLCLEVQNSIIEVLVKKTLRAGEKYQVKSILLSGGVAANQALRDQFKFELNTKRYTLHPKFFAPAKNLCTDNAAMIGSAAFYNYKEVSWQTLTANPELYFS